MISVEEAKNLNKGAELWTIDERGRAEKVTLDVLAFGLNAGTGEEYVDFISVEETCQLFEASEVWTSLRDIHEVLNEVSDDTHVYVGLDSAVAIYVNATFKLRVCRSKEGYVVDVYDTKDNLINTSCVIEEDLEDS